MRSGEGKRAKHLRHAKVFTLNQNTFFFILLGVSLTLRRVRIPAIPFPALLGHQLITLKENQRSPKFFLLII